MILATSIVIKFLNYRIRTLFCISQLAAFKASSRLRAEIAQIERDSGAIKPQNVVEQRAPDIMLVHFFIGCHVYLLKQRLDIGSRDSQFADSLPVGCEDEVSSGRIVLVFEHDEGGDCIAAPLLVADVAEFVDKGAEDLLWVFDVDVWLWGWRLGGMFDCVDKSLVEDDWFIEFMSGSAG